MEDKPRIWLPHGTINAHALPPGSMISPALEEKRQHELMNNSTYRENIEKACRMVGYLNKGLIMNQKIQPASPDAVRAIIRQNKKAEQILKAKRSQTNESPIISSLN